MAKVQVSHRLDEDLLQWATEYGESRSSSRAVVIEEALRHFQALSRGGVPDLPAAEPKPVPKWKPKPGVPRNLLAGRQARLNREMGWDK